MEKNAKFILGASISVIAFVAIGAFSYVRSKNLLIGPQINIHEPQNGAIFRGPPIQISGIAKNIARINLNGAQIFTDSLGNFKEELLLLPGYNILTVEAEDRFGKKVKKTLELVYKEKISGELASTSLPTL